MPPSDEPRTQGARDLALALLLLACLALVANLCRPDPTEPRPGLFPPEALQATPGDDQEFADLTLSDLLLGLAQPERPPLPRNLVLEREALLRTLSREHLLFCQRVRKRHLGRPRDDAANLATVQRDVAR